MERIFEIEEANPELNSIEINGLKMWPFLRIAIRYLLLFNTLNHRGQHKKTDARSSSILKAGLSFLSQIPQWLRPKKFFLLSNILEKKVVNGKVIDKLSQHLIDQYGNDTLIFQAISHDFADKLEEPFINLSPWTKISGKLFRAKKMTYSPGSVELLDKVLRENDLKFKDLEGYIYNFFTDLKFWFFVLRLKSPKYLFTECYSYFAPIYAANKLGIETIEFQHGLMGPNVSSYESKFKLDPDFRCKTVLLWGRAWSKNLSGNAISIGNTIPIGNYYLDLLEVSPLENDTIEIKRGFNKIVTSPLDSFTEDEIIELILAAAPKNSDTLFILVPRLRLSTENTSAIASLKNIKVINDKSFQEIIRISDYYIATNSACLFESLKFGVPGIVIDKDGSFREIFKELTDDNTVKYITKAEEFNELIKGWRHPSKTEIKQLSSHLFQRNSRERLSQFISKSLVSN